MNRPKVLVTQRHPGDALDTLAQFAEVDRSHADLLSPEELLSRLRDKDAVLSFVPDRIGASVMERCPRLKLIANSAVGYDNIDLHAATARGILVLNTPGVLDDTTADLSFALLMAAARRLVEADRFVRAGHWRAFTPDLMLGTDVHGKTLGIIGLGRIGSAVARRARGFDMRILYWQRRQAPQDVEERLGASYVTLDDLLRQSDFVSIHCPLSSDTQRLIGERELQLMRPTSMLINTARGPIVDERALAAALRSGRIAGAALDVFSCEPSVPQELIDLDNVVLAPHIGSASRETRSAMAAMSVRGLIEAFQGRKPVNCVNEEVWDCFRQRCHSG